MQNLISDFNNISKDILSKNIKDVKVFPLSSSQKRLWFLEYLNDKAKAYNLFRVFKFDGNLQLDILEKSINEVIKQQKSLNSIFIEKKGQLFQVYCPERYFELPFVDFTILPEIEKQKKADSLIIEYIEKPFKITKWPIFRQCVIKIDTNKYLLCFVMHHIISDWWSMGLLFNKIANQYNYLSQAKKVYTEELTHQYFDFVNWQNDLLANGKLDSQLDYWKQQLIKITEAALPTDFQRPQIPVQDGKLEIIVIPENITHKIKQLCLKENISLFIFLLSVFSVLIKKYANCKDISIGIPIANRNKEEFEHIIGFFINIVVIRLNFEEKMSFMEHLSLTKKVAYNAYDNQDIPFEKVVEAINPSRTGNKNPLFQVFFNMLNSNDKPIKLNDIDVERINYDINVRSYFDFTFYITDKKDTISLTALYDTDLFTSARIQEILRQYLLLLDEVSENPNKLIDEYTIRTDLSQKYLPDPTSRIDSLKGEKFLLNNIKLHDQEKIAISDLYGNWSYSEIEKVSNQLVNCLRKKNVNKDDVIAIIGDRSVPLVLSIIAVIKLDCIFVLLDPNKYPEKHIIHQIEITKPKAYIVLENEKYENKPTVNNYIADSDFLLKLSVNNKEEIVSLLRDYSCESTFTQKEPDKDLYIVFTSGTTGKPKAIIGSQRPVSNFIESHIGKYKLDSSYRFAMLSGLTHDPLLRDIFVPLWTGSTLYIPDEDTILSLGLSNWLDSNQINVINITPSQAHILVYDLDKTVNSIKLIFCGGDLLDNHLTFKLKTKFPNARIINCYGTTETPQVMSYYEIPESFYANYSKGKFEKIHIGSQTDYSQILIINQNNITGVGETGEIWIKSPYLAKGYYKDEQKTNETFLTDQFTYSGRIYKTGDRGRYNPDGSIEILGREDRQIKIRGFRIELSEIEAIIKQYPSIDKCAVIPISKNNDNSLHAFYESATNIPTIKFKSFLRLYLPEHMVPAGFTKVDPLPVNINGKVDYMKLNKIQVNLNYREQNNPLSTPFEKKIGELWMDILQINKIDASDNFFDIGGHSLKAIELIAKIKNDFKIDVTFRDFINQNLKQFSSTCETKIKNNG